MGVVKGDKEIEPVSWTERWDDRIRATSIKVGIHLLLRLIYQVEAIAASIQAKGLLPANGQMATSA